MMLERLTIRNDACVEPENAICYVNPNDPDGLYNILDLAECLYCGGEEEAEILLEISKRLAAYEDTGLTPEEVKGLQYAFDKLGCEVDVLDGKINTIIEAQQQEIYGLKQRNEILKGLVKQVTTDKDEQIESLTAAICGGISKSKSSGTQQKRKSKLR